MSLLHHVHHSRFIETFGTHVIVGVKMGGKDVIYVKQQHSSPLQSANVQKQLKEMADKRFLDSCGQYSMPSEQLYQNDKVCDEHFYTIIRPLLGYLPFVYQFRRALNFRTRWRYMGILILVLSGKF